MAPNFNHYKAGFLNKLAEFDSSVQLTILAGKTEIQQGHKEFSGELGALTIDTINVTKENFGFSLEVVCYLHRHFHEYDWVMIPREKKFFLLILFGVVLRFCHNSKTKLFSYNHPITSSHKKFSLMDKISTYLFYRWYDRIIFYNQASYKWAIDHRYIKPQKAFWANNTLDSDKIDACSKFRYPDFDTPGILYIGRLIASKKIELLFKYYYYLTNLFKKQKISLRLFIIGDGPLRNTVQQHADIDDDITWYGAVTDEPKIASVMKSCSIVFIPGSSGLSINHAFLYGRPYVTIQADDHGPEISYLADGKNGLLLNGDFATDVKRLYSILSDRHLLKLLCDNALDSGKQLTIQNWCSRISDALN